jgi:hypothetical protein
MAGVAVGGKRRHLPGQSRRLPAFWRGGPRGRVRSPRLLDDPQRGGQARPLSGRAGGRQAGRTQAQPATADKRRSFSPASPNFPAKAGIIIVLQLFDGPAAPALVRHRVVGAPGKDAASPAHPSSLLEAVEVPFALTNADWPALVVDKTGAVIRANPAATRVFGAAVAQRRRVAVILAAGETRQTLE